MDRPQLRDIQHQITDGRTFFHDEKCNLRPHPPCVLQHTTLNGETEWEYDCVETAPLRHPERYSYDHNLPDIAEVWRRGTVIASWFLGLAKFAGRVSDSGEGRWTIAAAIDESVPAPVFSAALYERFSSRGETDFADKVLSALRYQFGGHDEKAATTKADA